MRVFSSSPSLRAFFIVSGRRSRLAMTVARQLVDQRQAVAQRGRGIADASADDDRRGGLRLLQRRVVDVGAVQHLHRGRHQGHANAGSDEADGRLQFIGPLRHADLQTVRGEQRHYMVGVARARIARVQHERLADQFGQAHGAGQQRMTRGQSRHQRFEGQHLLVDRRIVDMDTAKADVDASGLERLHLLHRRRFRQAQLQVGVTAQAADQLRQDAVEGGGGETDAEPSLFPRADAPGVVANLAQLLEQGAGVLVEEAPGLGQAQRPAAFEQGHAELVFELLELPAQRRLGDVQALGGAGEIEGFGERLEIAQMTKLHGWLSFKGGDTCGVLLQTKSILEPLQAQYQYQGIDNNNLMGIEMNHAAIESLEAIIVDLPTIRPHKLAMHTMQNQTLVILRRRCADGIEGIGEATTIGGLSYGNESPDSIKVNLDRHFAPLLIGQDASNINACMQRIDRVVKGNTFARSAVETALLDAQGKRLGLPVSEILGGRVRDSLEVAWTLASGDTRKDIAEAEQMLDARRHRIFKLKIGAGEVNKDLAHVIAIKQALGERASVRVDVNQAWDEAVALRACRILGDNGIDLIEQPISRHNRGGQVRLNQSSPAPIMADESIECVEDAFNLARDGAAPVFALKIAKNGGPRAVLRTASIAEAAGIGLYGGTMLEGSVGTLASAHAFITLNKLTWDTELFGPLLLTEDIVTEPPLYRDFHLHVPRLPGIGLTLDEERLARFRRP